MKDFNLIKPIIAWIGVKLGIVPFLNWIGVTVAITTNILQGLSFLAITLYTFYKLYLLHQSTKNKNLPKELQKEED
ncbi:unnamed protein product [marine sediment metagenome]|uniref:Uncharacterized protein n=1 Tax=marine sediment metagenome TaxID=412755 RepID=X0TEH4_9ZZZZ